MKIRLGSVIVIVIVACLLTSLHNHPEDFRLEKDSKMVQTIATVADKAEEIVRDFGNKALNKLGHEGITDKELDKANEITEKTNTIMDNLIDAGLRYVGLKNSGGD